MLIGALGGTMRFLAYWISEIERQMFLGRQTDGKRRQQWLNAGGKERG